MSELQFSLLSVLGSPEHFSFQYKWTGRPPGSAEITSLTFFWLNNKRMNHYLRSDQKFECMFPCTFVRVLVAVPKTTELKICLHEALKHFQSWIASSILFWQLFRTVMEAAVWTETPRSPSPPPLQLFQCFPKLARRYDLSRESRVCLQELLLVPPTAPHGGVQKTSLHRCWPASQPS